DQPRADAGFLELEVIGRPEGAEVGFLDEVLGAVRVPRHALGQAKEQVEMLEGKGFELLAIELHRDRPGRRAEFIRFVARPPWGRACEMPPFRTPGTGWASRRSRSRTRRCLAALVLFAFG